MNKSLFFIAAALMLPLSAEAQVMQAEPMAPTKVEAMAEAAVEPAASAVEEAAPALPPTETTPEQKVEARKGLMKSVQRAAADSDVQQRRQMVDAVSTLEKIRNRRANLKKPAMEKVDYQEPTVNLHDRKDVQKYLQKVYVEPLNDSFVTPEQE